MASNAIYFKQWKTEVGSLIRVEIYPQTTITGTNTALPSADSRYVELGDEILVSVGSIETNFDTLPIGLPETGTLQMTVNLSNCVDHLRERFLANNLNLYPPVWVVFLSTEEESWKDNALFVGVQKRVPNCVINIDNNGDEMLDFDIVYLFRYVAEQVKLDNENTLAALTSSSTDFEAKRLYDYAVAESGDKVHADFAMGGVPGAYDTDQNYSQTAFMVSLTEFNTYIANEIDRILKRMFMKSSEILVMPTNYPHKSVVRFFDAATSLSNTISTTQTTSDLFFVWKITDKDDNIIGGELYDAKAGILKLGNAYDYFKNYAQNFCAKVRLLFNHDPEGWSGTIAYNVEMVGAMEGITLEFGGGPVRYLSALKDGRSLEIGSGSIRSCRSIIQNPSEIDADEYETKLVGADTERDFDVQLHFHNHPTIPENNQSWKPGEKLGILDRSADVPNPDVKSGYSDRPSATMNSCFDYFPYSKIYLRYNNSGGVRTLEWTDATNVFIKPAENVYIYDGQNVINQHLATHPAIGKFVGRDWKQHKLAVQSGNDSRVGLGNAVSDYITNVFGSPYNSTLMVQSDNIYPFDLGFQAATSVASSIHRLNIAELGFSTQTRAVLHAGAFNVQNQIVGVEYNLTSGTSNVKIWIRGVH